MPEPMMPLPTSYAALHGAALVRLAELEKRVLELEAEGLDARPLQLAMLDLHGGLEEIAQATNGQMQADIIGYLQDTYGLLAVATDPLLRPLLPPIPATGATVRYRVRGQNGKARVLNGQYLVARGASLSSFTSDLAP